MYIYLSAIFILTILFLVDKGENNPHRGIFSLVLMFLVVSGHNGDMNCDYQHYMNFFTGDGFSMYGSVYDPNEIEPGYVIFVKALRMFFSEYYEYIIFWGLFICIPFAILARRKSNNVILSVLFFMILNNGRNFMTFFCAHRQMLAMTMLLIALIIAQKQIKFWKPLCLVICLGTLFVHSTAAFVLPIAAFLYYIRIENDKVYYYGAIGSFIVSQFFSLSDSFQRWALIASSYLEGNRSIDHLMDVQENLSIWQYLPLTLMFCVFVYFYYKKDLNNYFLKCFFCSVMLKNLFGFFPHIARTILIFCILAMIGAIPETAKEYSERRKQTIWYMIVIAMFTYLEYRVLVNFNPNVNYWCLPYNFIWE